MVPDAVETVRLKLDQEVRKEKVSVAEQIALDDSVLRRWMARRIVWTFIIGNLVTLAALGALSWLDQTNIERHMIAPDTRIVSQQVIMALLGATTVQIGTIAVIIARYLFPGRSRE